MNKEPSFQFVYYASKLGYVNLLLVDRVLNSIIWCERPVVQMKLRLCRCYVPLPVARCFFLPNFTGSQGPKAKGALVLLTRPRRRRADSASLESRLSAVGVAYRYGQNSKY